MYRGDCNRERKPRERIKEENRCEDKIECTVELATQIVPSEAPHPPPYLCEKHQEHAAYNFTLPALTPQRILQHISDSTAILTIKTSLTKKDIRWN